MFAKVDIMNVQSHNRLTSPVVSRPVRPNPADTITTGQELGTDDIQKDLFSLSTGVAGTRKASSLAEFGKSQAKDSWHQGALAVAASLAGGAVLGAVVVKAAKALSSNPTEQAYLSTAAAFEGKEELLAIHRASEGLGDNAHQQGLFAIAAGVAGERGAGEAIDVGLSKGQNKTEAGFYSMATAVAGGARALGPLLRIAEDFASDESLNGPYALAASLAGRDSAQSVLRMAEALGETPKERAAFSLAGALLGAERAPGFVRLARAVSENPTQVPAMTVAAALTGAPTSRTRATAVVGAMLFQEQAQPSRSGPPRVANP